MRAWTFQERFFSCRNYASSRDEYFRNVETLIGTKMVALEADDYILEIGWSLRSATTRVLVEHEFLNLQQYCDFVEAYLKR
jgi:hypothetical protein